MRMTMGRGAPIVGKHENDDGMWCPHRRQAFTMPRLSQNLLDGRY